jgi:hypothetical protein
MRAARFLGALAAFAITLTLVVAPAPASAEPAEPRWSAWVELDGWWYARVTSSTGTGGTVCLTGGGGHWCTDEADVRFDPALESMTAVGTISDGGRSIDFDLQLKATDLPEARAGRTYGPPTLAICSIRQIPPFWYFGIPVPCVPHTVAGAAAWAEREADAAGSILDSATGTAEATTGSMHARVDVVV